MLAGLTQVFAHAVLCAEPATLKGRRFGNVILVAADQPMPADALALRAGLGPFPYRVLTGARLDHLSLGANPFTDARRAGPRPTDLLLGPRAHLARRLPVRRAAVLTRRWEVGFPSVLSRS